MLLFWKPKGLDSILSKFTSTLAQLQKLQEYNQNKVDENSAKIDDLLTKNNTLVVEAEKAKSVQEKINNLLS